MKKNSRFIAGAICPSCEELDSLVLDADDHAITCVSCEYTQTAEQRDQPKANNNQSNETMQEKPQIINIKNLS
jgi:uncharacterized metal-binding protein (TIGR02443 family)